MYVQRVSGTYYEMGLKIGQTLKTTKSEGIIPTFSAEKLEKGMTYEAEVQKYAPDLLDELRGIADGWGIDYEKLATNELSPYHLNPSCLVMACSGEHTQTGLPILARNHEWVEEDKDSLTLCYSEPQGKIGSFGFTFHTINLSRFGGINQAGLALSGTTTNFTNSGPGVMFNVATRWILDNCKTTEEAVAFLKKIPKTWGIDHLIIDKNNTIAKVEAHREKTKVTKSKNGFGVVTLLFDSPEMEPYNRTDESGNLYYPRTEYLTKWFEQHQGKITEELIMEVLKNHEHRICDHSTDGKFNYGICWSWILTIGQEQGLVCAGPPCKNEFKQYNIS